MGKEAIASLWIRHCINLIMRTQNISEYCSRSTQTNNLFNVQMSYPMSYGNQLFCIDFHFVVSTSILLLDSTCPVYYFRCWWPQIHVSFYQCRCFLRLSTRYRIIPSFICDVTDSSPLLTFPFPSIRGYKLVRPRITKILLNRLSMSKTYNWFLIPKPTNYLMNIHLSIYEYLLQTIFTTINFCSFPILNDLIDFIKSNVLFIFFLFQML